MSKPVAVLISDIHFTPATLELASSALRQAKAHAIELKVPLVLAGDTLDSKALMRAECVNRLIEIFTEPEQATDTFVLVGNHDLLNEKGTAHSLEFLKPYVIVVDNPYLQPEKCPVLMVPYCTNPKDLLDATRMFTKKYPIICHQGVQTAFMGHYTQDKTSLPKEVFADFRVISGHYHRRQDIKCGRPRQGAIGLFSYIGNPYTQNFGEANDPEKGFQILHDDGSLEFVPTNLRRHVILELERDVGRVNVLSSINPHDLIWLKIRAPQTYLDSLDKTAIGNHLFGHDNYKLDLIPTDNAPVLEEIAKDLEPQALFDTVIDNTQESDEIKTYMKSLWREVTS